jgi:hypothetical protein
MIVAGLIALAFVAHAPAWQITIAPDVVAVSSGHAYTVTVYDTGHTTLNVRMRLAQILRVRGVCQVGQVAPSWAHVSPAHVALSPGQRSGVSVRIQEAATVSGAHSLAVMAVAKPGSQPASIKVAGAVASLALVRFPGHTAGRPCVTLPGRVRASGLPWWSRYAVLALVALAGILWAWWYIRRGQRRWARTH